MTLTSAINADRRARADYLPPCPLCSFLNADVSIIRTPFLREFTRIHQGQSVTTYKLDHCCALSNTTEQFDSAAEAAKWWRNARQQPRSCTATESRRRHTMARLQEAGYEPIE
jgi:hypothetical protein